MFYLYNVIIKELMYIFNKQFLYTKKWTNKHAENTFTNDILNLIIHCNWYNYECDIIDITIAPHY